MKQEKTGEEVKVKLIQCRKNTMHARYSTDLIPFTKIMYKYLLFLYVLVFFFRLKCIVRFCVSK